jgi:hypothetical protein
MPWTSILTLLMVLISTRFSLYDLADTHFSVFCEIFLKPRTLTPTYDNFVEETIVLSGWSEYFSLTGWQLWHSMFYAIFNNMKVKPTLLKCKFKWWHVQKYTRLKTLINRSHWPRRLRRRPATAPLLRVWVRIPPAAWMPVSCECCLLSEVSVTSWSLVQRSSTDCGGSLCVI